MYTLSLIIPIYKVQKYIEECLKSVLDQLPPNVEIICIDDGSPDNSLELAKKLISQYTKKVQDQFVFIEQVNMGLSGARNTGLSVAQGKYIGFLDSDDKLSSNYFKEVIKILNKDKYDIIDFNLITSENEVILTRRDSFNSIFSISRWYCPARIFKADLIKKHKFAEGIYYEDVELTPRLYLEATKSTHIDQALYWYRTNDNSITQSFSLTNSLKTINSLEKVLLRYLSLYEDTNNGYYAIVAIHCYFSLCINACTRFNRNKSYTFIKKYHKVISNFALADLPIDNKSFDSKIKVFLKYPRLYITLYQDFYRLRKALKR